MSLKHRLMFMRLFRLVVDYFISCGYIWGILLCMAFFIALRFMPFLIVAWVLIHFVRKLW